MWSTELEETSFLHGAYNADRPGRQAFVQFVQYHFIDVIRLRLTRPPTETELRSLGEGARLNRGHPIRGFINQVLTVHVPDEHALQVLAKLPGALVNYVEIARDTIVPDPEALHEFYNRHFVQPWHGTRKTVIGTPTYTDGQQRRGRRFCWYSDRCSKVTGEVDCFHLEGRYQGAAAVRKLGIHHPRDLLDFDHAAYWAKNIQLYQVDFERLGRFYQNRRQGSRRRNPSIDRFGSFAYNRDHAIGGVIYANLAAHPNQPEKSCSVQCLVDQFGRGSFLIPIRPDTL